MVDVRGLSRDFVIPVSVSESAGAGVVGRRSSPRWTLGRRASPPLSTRTFRALDGVTFKVAAGEVVGVIGRNGAGKSTLLRILARTLAPSAGEADLHGRVGSLLEIGTGFHPDLTGRENIFLNGALLGMSPREVEDALDDILAFAEVGDFVDAPLKFYSAGMYLRLAFAVAVHLRADVLLLDEVLSVGDEWFAKKCRARIESACRSGRTVLIVGHDLDSLRSLCTRLLLLEAGRLTGDGDPETIVRQYRGSPPAPSLKETT